MEKQTQERKTVGFPSRWQQLPGVCLYVLFIICYIRFTKDAALTYKQLNKSLKRKRNQFLTLLPLCTSAGSCIQPTTSCLQQLTGAWRVLGLSLQMPYCGLWYGMLGHELLELLFFPAPTELESGNIGIMLSVSLSDRLSTFQFPDIS